MIKNVHSFFREGDGACTFSLKAHAVVYVLSYDMFITIFFTGLFLWPLVPSSRRSALIRRVALRTLCASAIALTTSTSNVIVLVLLQEHELGWLCLGTCCVDVSFNTMALYWVTHFGLKNDESPDDLECSKSKITSIQFRSFAPRNSISGISSSAPQSQRKIFLDTSVHNRIEITKPDSSMPKMDSQLHNDLFNPPMTRSRELELDSRRAQPPCRLQCCVVSAEKSFCK
ncbi:hypothetical protein BT96DRAFT_452037 [Gymnopus androsaceus JB14]|uniref:Uncharacterized protein n=1 Tax=Gymnopus androsaceus JB14 TaxID=1447944 RepID=A0A6A4I1J5_9AGAR|nr:hypothetical protein BT96DRAFT_452037 [Gymnopus androsaceus JB14]